MDKLSHFKLGLLLLGWSYFCLMFGNGVVSLTHPDEVFYAQTAKEMLTHHSWLTPMIFDEPQFEKPILFYVLLAGVFKFLGISPFTARLIPALFGMAGVLVTYGISYLLFRSKKGAFLSGMILSSSFIYLALSRAVLTDMVFSILVVVTMGFFYQAYASPKKSFAVFWAWVFCALAVLTKGALGIVFPVGLAVLFLWATRTSPGIFSRRFFWMGVLAFLIIAVPWHILMYQWYGESFIREYWNNVHVRRIFDAEHPKSNTWYFYPMTMFGGVFPWCVFLVPALYGAYRHFREGRMKRESLFLAIWILWVFVVVQGASSKLASYVFPVFPALAIFLGRYWNEILEEGASRGRSLFRRTAYIWAGALFVLAVAILVAGQKYATFINQPRFVYAMAAVFLLLAAAVAWFAFKDQRIKVLTATASLTAIVLVVLFSSPAYFEPWVSCKWITDDFKNIDQSQSPILSAKFYARGVRFYTNRPTAVIDINGKGFFSPHPIPYLNTDEKVLEFLAERPVTYGILKRSNVGDLERITRGRFQMHFYRQLGGKYIYRIEKI